MPFAEEHKEEFDSAIEFLRGDVAVLRTGRATPALVEDIAIEAYGVKQPLKTLASISVSDAKTLVIEPWDKSILGNIESSLRASDLGINPVNDGKLIRLPLPELSTERRQELIKVLHQKLEAARVSIRKIREDLRREIDRKEKDKEMGEDEKFTQQDELEKIVKEYNEKIKQVGEEKEKDITTV